MSYFQPKNEANYNQPTVQQPGGQQQGNYAYQQQNYLQQPNQGQPIQQPYPPQQQYNQPPPQYYQQQPQQPQQPQYYQGQPIVQYQQPVYAQPVVITSQIVRPQVVVVPIGSGNVCKYCLRDFIMMKQKRIGAGTIIAFLLLLLIFWPLCWLPFVMDDCKDTYYTCNNCGKVVSEKSYSLC